MRVTTRSDRLITGPGWGQTLATLRGQGLRRPITLKAGRVYSLCFVCPTAILQSNLARHVRTARHRAALLPTALPTKGPE